MNSIRVEAIDNQFLTRLIQLAEIQYVTDARTGNRIAICTVAIDCGHVSDLSPITVS